MLCPTRSTPPNRLWNGLTPIAILLAVAAIALFAPPARAQYLFPDLVPSSASLVVSVPQADGAWRAFESMRIVKAAEGLLRQETDGANPAAAGATRAMVLDEEIASKLGFTLDGQTLFGGILSATELAMLPPAKGNLTPGFLWLGRVRDATRLRQILDVFEAEIVRRSALASNSVTRATESIGDSRVVVLTDPTASIGYFLNGPGAVWAFSNDPGALRDAARALDLSLRGARPGAARPPAGRSDVPGPALLDAPLTAMRDLRKIAKGENFHVKFFVPAPRLDDWRMREGQSGLAPRAIGVAGIDPLLNRFRPQGAMAGGLRFGPTEIEIQSLTLLAPGDTSLSASLYRSTRPMKNLAGVGFMAADALILGGNNLFDAPQLRKYLLAAIDGWEAVLPGNRRPGLNDASAQARERLESLRQTLSDPDLLSELGPEWFFALNDFEFIGPGNFPRVDFVVGFRTRDAARTRERMTRIEDGLTQAAREWAHDRATTPTASTLSPLTVSASSSTLSTDAGSSGASTSSTLLSAPAPPLTIGFQETTATLAPDQPPVPVRYFASSRLPKHLRPAWCIADDTLLIGLSPDVVTRAVGRAASPSPLEPDLRALMAEAGMDSAHSFQAIRFSRAAGILLAILQPIVSKVQPDAMPQLGAMAQALDPIETIAFFRQGSHTGIRTAGIVRMRETEPGR